MYTIYRNNLGQVDAINALSGSSLVFDPLTKTFDESHPNTIALREWEKENGTLDLSDRPVDPITLDQAKNQKKQEIIAIAINKQEELVAGFAPPEQASWARKVSEAKAFLASSLIEDAPMLKVEAIAISGATNNTVIFQYTQGLANKILSKSEEMYLSSATISGKRTNLSAKIEAAKTFEELNAIAWN
jgi:hypothetical protein